MSVDLDVKWLQEQAADEKSLKSISRIQDWRDFVLKNNEFIKGQELFPVNLGKYQVWFRECSAFSSIEVYQEIFKGNDHFIVPEFSGKDAKIVVDIGANEGFYTLKVKENNPDCNIIAIEPNPYVFEILEKNMESNCLKNVTLVNKAIGSSNGLMKLEIIKEIGSISARDIRLVDRSWMKDEFVKEITVGVITLDTLCREHHVTSIDILKIDVEGMEAEILASATGLLKNVRRIVLERHSRELRDTVVALLQDNGFALIYEEDPLQEKYYGDLYFFNQALK